MDQQIDAAVKIRRPVHQRAGEFLQRGDIGVRGGVQIVQPRKEIAAQKRAVLGLQGVHLPPRVELEGVPLLIIRRGNAEKVAELDDLF